MKTPLISGRTSTSGWCHFELLADHRLHGDLRRADDAFEQARRPVRHLVRPARHVAGDGDLALRDMVEGERIAGAAVDQTRPSMLTGRNRAGMATEAAIAGRSGPSVRIASVQA